MKILTVGMRDLRNNLAKYLNGDKPIAVVRHGLTLGYFIPASISAEELELDTLKQASSTLNELIKERKGGKH